jgi:drug/metabolite transporter (DMT)-like permease
MLIVSVTLFGGVDAISKVLVTSQSFGQIMLARYLISLIALLAVTAPTGWRRLFATTRPLLQLVRGCTPFMIGGSMVFGVKYLPLADATTILFAGPFLVVAVAGWLLREKVAANVWIGVAAGFLGVVIVARPGFSGLSLYAIFPVVGALFYAALQLLSRWLGTLGEAPLTTVAWTLLAGTLAALPPAVADWPPLDTHAWLLVLLLGVIFGGGQYFMAKAYVLAPANLLAPFSYAQILVSVVLGLALFGDIPDHWTIFGIVLIVASGVYVMRGSRPPVGQPARPGEAADA